MSRLCVLKDRLRSICISTVSRIGGIKGGRAAGISPSSKPFHCSLPEGLKSLYLLIFYHSLSLSPLLSVARRRNHLPLAVQNAIEFSSRRWLHLVNTKFEFNLEENCFQMIVINTNSVDVKRKTVISCELVAEPWTAHGPRDRSDWLFAYPPLCGLKSDHANQPACLLGDELDRLLFHPASLSLLLLTPPLPLL